MTSSTTVWMRQTTQMPLAECCLHVCPPAAGGRDGAQPKNPARIALREGKDIPFGSARHDVASVGCVTQVEWN